MTLLRIHINEIKYLRRIRNILIRFVQFFLTLYN